MDVTGDSEAASGPSTPATPPRSSESPASTPATTCASRQGPAAVTSASVTAMDMPLTSRLDSGDSRQQPTLSLAASAPTCALPPSSVENRATVSGSLDAQAGTSSVTTLVNTHEDLLFWETCFAETSRRNVSRKQQSYSQRPIKLPSTESASPAASEQPGETAASSLSGSLVSGIWQSLFGATRPAAPSCSPRANAKPTSEIEVLDI